MAENPTVLKIRAEVENLQGLNRLKNAVRRVSQEVKASNVDFKKQIANIKELQVNTKNSVNNLRAQKDAFLALRDSVDVTSKEFKEATRQVNKLDKALAKAEGRKSQRGGRLGGIARGVGAVAAGGVFGGPEGAIGGALGLLATGGNPLGAAVGAAVGAQVGQIRKAAGGLAEVVATYNKYQIALAGVSKDQDDFNESINAAKGFSEQFVVPLDKTISNYTKLKASVVGAGFGTKETNKAFEALSASVLATGGNSEDLNAALRAASQVFSKGKVSAEELRQQIGERLPGAFTIFADSMGITTKELDKLLEQGKVDLTDFVGFTEELISRYGGTAAELAKAPELAGQRLEVALTNANIAYGGFFQKVGAGFQDYMTNLVNFAVDNKQQFLRIVATVAAFGQDIFAQVVNAAQNIARPFVIVFNALEVKIENLMAQFGLLFKAAEAFGKLIVRADGFDGFDLPPSGRPSVQERTSAILAQLEELFGEFSPDKFGLGLRDPALDLGGDPSLTDPSTSGGRTPVDTSERMVDLYGRLGDALQAQNLELVAQTEYLIRNEGIALKFENGKITAMEQRRLLQDSLNKLIEKGIKLREKAKKGEDDLTEGAKSVKQQFENIGKTIKGAVVDNLTQAIMGAKSLGEALGNVLRQAGSLFISFGLKQIFPFLNANGNVYDQSGFVPFAKGGIVNKPTLFPFAKGIGLMGEAGPEAIMPLRRGPSGRLGVEAAGGGVGNVVVNVDASGSAVQGDSNQADQLGKAIGAAVQAELLKQKRPGGMLAGV